MTGWLIALNVYAVGASVWGLIRLAVGAQKEARRIDLEANDPVDPAAVSEFFPIELIQELRGADALLDSVKRAATSGPAIAWRDVLILGSAVVAGGAANIIPLVWTVDPLFG
ncbi:MULTISPECIES: hypothetical protein [unclassified Rathayibacter]|uniref:hypothetical protein n=1 Tax=unclassified Rathayibacter TaxID=2609250 RepID=UPI000CE7924B|nr:MULTISPECIES: hypothetical protein [unclassified Rathayibacter]PPF24079.1 hypothetical protein C5C54_16900 [Rathayibacter sp. AY1F2]PPF32053.1 hypothetical protein C5B93_16295 [Rathayibacter sp. AY1A2]PPG60967.1 hypothetical protein C5C57_02465 [Rathayibacter sp. AY1C5]PPH21496.1 hypothetical protein C5C99_06135 [Rathayibacter sp. AY1C4]PPH41482.1 hypothetical protein C5C42_16515 [Rathayibacter sp. AY1F7]